MEIEQVPTEARYERPTGERRGLIMVHTGNGKGKSTAAFGLALRAFGRSASHGKKVKIYQFMKVPSARFGEHRMFEQLGIPIIGLGDGFSWKSKDQDNSAELAQLSDIELHTLCRRLSPHVVLVTLGSRGCFLSTPEKHEFFPAVTGIKVVDTTGAGTTPNGQALTVQDDPGFCSLAKGEAVPGAGSTQAAPAASTATPQSSQAPRSAQSAHSLTALPPTLTETRRSTSSLHSRQIGMREG